MSSVLGMLQHYGFSSDEDGLQMPDSLRSLLLMCIKTHKMKLPDLRNQDLHPHALMSNAISWEECMNVNKYMHGVGSKDNIDYRCHAFGLQLSQGLYRQERAGKTGALCVCVCVCVSVSVGVRARVTQPSSRFSLYLYWVTQKSLDREFAWG